jgi:hypothetical protein
LDRVSVQFEGEIARRTFARMASSIGVDDFAIVENDLCSAWNTLNLFIGKVVTTLSSERSSPNLMARGIKP